MTDTNKKGPRSKGKKEQNQVVNEQDQQQKVNSGADFQSTSDSIGNPVSAVKNNQPGVMESQPGLEEGNSYEDDPKRGENKMPVN